MNIPKVLALIRPTSEWTLRGSTMDTLEWHDTSTQKPTDEEMRAGQNQLDGLSYRDKRVPAYPSIGDQLDALWKIIAHGDFDKLPGDAQNVLNKILDVKTQFPKTL